MTVDVKKELSSRDVIEGKNCFHYIICNCVREKGNRKKTA